MGISNKPGNPSAPKTIVNSGPGAPGTFRSGSGAPGNFPAQTPSPGTGQNFGPGAPGTFQNAGPGASGNFTPLNSSAGAPGTFGYVPPQLPQQLRMDDVGFQTEVEVVFSKIAKVRAAVMAAMRQQGREDSASAMKSLMDGLLSVSDGMEALAYAIARASGKKLESREGRAPI
jgi:hypothetical protein